MKKNTGWKIIILPLIMMAIAPSVSAGLFDRPDFFERGDEEFEREIRQFEEGQAVPDSSLTIDEANRNGLLWSRLVVRGGGFTIAIPQGTISEETKIVETPQEQIEFKIVASHPPSSRFVAAYSEELDTKKTLDPDSLLTRARDRIIENNAGFTTNTNVDLTFDNYPGKEFTLENESERITFRLLLIEQRLYVLAVNQPKDTISAESVAIFFDSFVSI